MERGRGKEKGGERGRREVWGKGKGRERDRDRDWELWDWVEVWVERGRTFSFVVKDG